MTGFVSAARSLLVLVSFCVLAPAVHASPLRMTHGEHGIRILLPDLPPDILACVQGGVEIRVRYELLFCHSTHTSTRSECSHRERETRILRFDPIRDRYQLTKDLLQDDEEPVVSSLDSIASALEEIGRSRNFPIPSEDDHSQRFVKARAFAICKGERSFLTQVLNIFSLGIFGLPSFSTGWERFDLPTSQVAHQ